MVRLAIPGSIAERGSWLADPAGNLRLATNLLAWGGFAFLWHCSKPDPARAPVGPAALGLPERV